MPIITILPFDDTVEVPEKTSLTEIEQYITFGCRAGACGACLIEVMEGETNLSLPETDEIAVLDSLNKKPGSYRLACQCRVLGNVVIKQ